MTEPDLTGLAELAQTKPKTTKQPWQPLDFNSLAHGWFLGCDQSLTATGLVLLSNDEVAGVCVQDAVSFGIEPTEEYTSHEDTLIRVEELYLLMLRWVIETASRIGQTALKPIYVAHEYPAKGGGRMARPEISLLTAALFRRAIHGAGFVTTDNWIHIIGRQHHAKLACGDANAKKNVHHSAMAQHYYPWIRDNDLITNGAKRDALSIAIALAHKIGAQK